ncbi:magnesium-dependent phosphatase 1 isoform X2 [Harpegnathos saltator]|uniref:Magnesium-dependent phosphatase 1 n=1 Tax=Harpegnathos saltator TaxID=610380 RepID=E2C122_HARSA|nr:magnesium-dependent phosphatase 1 isoform X2 [Harpegnathos saltator]EFN78343.1 Magnesium-dependent phosphatase 1 [Harpegnathos saltator]
MERKPKIIVFDLDYTLWPFWVHTHYIAPFRKKSDKVVDAHGNNVIYDPDILYIIKRLYEQGYELGIASRTKEIEGAKQLLNLFGWDKYFKYVEIYPGTKVAHFSNIQKNSKVRYRDMLFFDDEYRNIVEIGKLSVYTVLVTNGVTQDLIEKSLKAFSRR